MTSRFDRGRQIGYTLAGIMEEKQLTNRHFAVTHYQQLGFSTAAGAKTYLTHLRTGNPYGKEACHRGSGSVV